MKNGEIWLVTFSPSIGDEIQKTRPAVVISNDKVGGLDLRIVAAITDGIKYSQPWHIRVSPSATNGLRKESLVDCFQIKCHSTQRFRKKIGILSARDMDAVKGCIAGVLDLL